MKPVKPLFFLPLLMAVTMTSCVVPMYPEGPRTASVGVSYRTYDTIPRGYVGDAYFYGGRYYSGGRYESGRFYDRGREYGDRYYYNGQYYYGGRHQHFADHRGSRSTGHTQVQVRRTHY